jgi:outer membrane protein assembly factor BamB
LRRAFRAAAAATSLIVVLAGLALAQTAPSWTEFQGGPAKTGSAADGPEPGYRQSWSTPFAPGGPGGRFGLSTPIVAGGLAVAVGPEQVLGLDLASGEQVLAVDRELGPSVPAAAEPDGTDTTIVYTEGWGDGPPTRTPTAAASPTEPGGTSTEAGGQSRLAAFDLRTEEAPWPPVRLDGVSRTGVTIADGIAFVGTDAGEVTAVDLADGSVDWRAEAGATVGTPLTVADGLVLVGAQGDRDQQPAVVALDVETGEQRWRHEPAVASAVVSAVSVQGDTAFSIFTGLSEASVVAIGMEDGAERWRRRAGAAFDVAVPPVLGGGSVFVVDLLGHVRALDVATGEERWDFALNAPVFRSVPTLVGSSLLVPTLEGDLSVIDIDSGELVWRRTADGSPLRTLVPAGDTLIAVRGGALSGVEAFEHDAEATLVREASPTTLAFGRMLGAMALAAIPILASVILLGRALVPRMGPAFPDEPVVDDDEPVRDPWEEDEGPAS